jgi:hypothetical protein
MADPNVSIRKLNSTYAYAEISDRMTGPNSSPSSNLHTMPTHTKVLTNPLSKYGMDFNLRSNHHCTYKHEYKVWMKEYNIWNKFEKK